ncbi:hypothetical protein [Sphingomonas aerophila]|jgi:hypothetical protein|uniref:DNA recombination protein RmuC n=1 Tax=Sphingomonas aerophila TaxID=1344948 RepID=A0A7W9BDP9_9SPHN|nr:hypothetical protein [Sphingomonas aerophila]MBB5715359.1 hypothetical protein [Sphingomonas aerophila]
MDTNAYLVLASASITGLGMVTAAGLAGWRGWLQLKRQELDHSHAGAAGATGAASAGARIEMADLRERIRKLEAIAAGVEL